MFNEFSLKLVSKREQTRFRNFYFFLALRCKHGRTCKRGKSEGRKYVKKKHWQGALRFSFQFLTRHYRYFNKKSGATFIARA